MESTLDKLEENDENCTLSDSDNEDTSLPENDISGDFTILSDKSTRERTPRRNISKVMKINTKPFKKKEFDKDVITSTPNSPAKRLRKKSPIKINTLGLINKEKMKESILQRTHQDSETSILSTTDEEDQIEDFPVDNLIKELSDLIRSCGKGDTASKESTPLKSSRQSSKVSCSSSTKSAENFSNQKPNKRKSRIPEKKTRRKLEIDMVEEAKRTTDPPDKEDTEEGEPSEEEGLLTIVEEPKRRRKSSTVEVSEIPEEVMEFIVKSSIDDKLQSIAHREKLTETHVKNIIKQVITDKSVLAMLRNSIYGIDPHDGNSALIYEPKLTRAKTKELYEKQMKVFGDEPSASHWGSNTVGGGNGGAEAEMHSLVHTEFPEDEDDEEYQPELDEQILSDEESMLSSGFGSPVTPSCTTGRRLGTVATPSSTTSLTPKSVTTPVNLVIAPKALRGEKRIVQRTLNFSKEETSLICSRTRSKFPMTDTPLEYLEMCLKPPDITADMYETEIDDEEWKKFLLDFTQPHEDTTKAGDDDEQVDPEYNLMADAEEEQPTLDELREELRGDKAVRISKKEVSELMMEFLDSFNVEEEEEEHRTNGIYGQIQVANIQQFDPGHQLAEEMFLSAESSHIFPQPQNDEYFHSQNDFIEEEVQEPIVVTYMIHQFSQEHIDILHCQMAQHAQLLTQSILMCCYADFLQYVEDGCKYMLNEMLSGGSENSSGIYSLFHPFNLQAALDTVAHYDAKKEEYEVRRSEYEKQRSSRYGAVRYKKGRPGSPFPPMIQEVFLESSAFPYLHLLPVGLFRTEPCFKRRGYFNSEYHLLVSAFNDVVSDLNIFTPAKDRKNSCFDRRLTKVCRSVVKQASVHTTASILNRRLRGFLQCLFEGEQVEDNPLMIFCKTGHVTMPKARVESLSKDYPCALKCINVRFLPYIYNIMVKKYCKNKEKEKTKTSTKIPTNTTTNPPIVQQTSSIVIIKDGATTQIILPPSLTFCPSGPSEGAIKEAEPSEPQLLVPPTTALEEEEEELPPPPVPRVEYPSFTIPRKRPVNTVAPTQITNTLSATGSSDSMTTNTPATVSYPGIIDSQPVVIMGPPPRPPPRPPCPPSRPPAAPSSLQRGGIVNPVPHTKEGPRGINLRMPPPPMPGKSIPDAIPPNHCGLTPSLQSPRKDSSPSHLSMPKVVVAHNSKSPSHLAMPKVVVNHDSKSPSHLAMPKVVVAHNSKSPSNLAMPKVVVNHNSKSPSHLAMPKVVVNHDSKSPSPFVSPEKGDAPATPCLHMPFLIDTPNKHLRNPDESPPKSVTGVSTCPASPLMSPTGVDKRVHGATGDMESLDHPIMDSSSARVTHRESSRETRSGKRGVKAPISLALGPDSYENSNNHSSVPQIDNGTSDVGEDTPDSDEPPHYQDTASTTWEEDEGSDSATNLPEAEDVTDLTDVTCDTEVIDVTCETEMADVTSKTEVPEDVTCEIEVIDLTCETEMADVTCETEVPEDVTCKTDMPEDVTCETEMADVTCETEMADVTCETEMADVTCETEMADATFETQVPEDVTYEKEVPDDAKVQEMSKRTEKVVEGITVDEDSILDLPVAERDRHEGKEQTASSERIKEPKSKMMNRGIKEIEENKVNRKNKFKETWNKEETKREKKKLNRCQAIAMAGNTVSCKQSVVKEQPETVTTELNSSVAREQHEALTMEITSSAAKEPETVTMDVNISVAKEQPEALTTNVNSSVAKEPEVTMDVNSSVAKEPETVTMEVNTGEDPTTPLKTMEIENEDHDGDEDNPQQDEPSELDFFVSVKKALTEKNSTLFLEFLSLLQTMTSQPQSKEAYSKALMHLDGYPELQSGFCTLFGPKESTDSQPQDKTCVNKRSKPITTTPRKSSSKPLQSDETRKTGKFSCTPENQRTDQTSPCTTLSPEISQSDFGSSVPGKEAENPKYDRRKMSLERRNENIEDERRNGSLKRKNEEERDCSDFPLAKKINRFGRKVEKTNVVELQFMLSTLHPYGGDCGDQKRGERVLCEGQELLNANVTNEKEENAYIEGEKTSSTKVTKEIRGKSACLAGEEISNTRVTKGKRGKSAYSKVRKTPITKGSKGKKGKSGFTENQDKTLKLTKGKNDSETSDDDSTEAVCVNKNQIVESLTTRTPSRNKNMATGSSTIGESNRLDHVIHAEAESEHRTRNERERNNLRTQKTLVDKQKSNLDLIVHRKANLNRPKGGWIFTSSEDDDDNYNDHNYVDDNYNDDESFNTSEDRENSYLKVGGRKTNNERPKKPNGSWIYTSSEDYDDDDDDYYNDNESFSSSEDWGETYLKVQRKKTNNKRINKEKGKKNESVKRNEDENKETRYSNVGRERSVRGRNKSENAIKINNKAKERNGAENIEIKQVAKAKSNSKDGRRKENKIIKETKNKKEIELNRKEKNNVKEIVTNSDKDKSNNKTKRNSKKTSIKNNDKGKKNESSKSESTMSESPNIQSPKSEPSRRQSTRSQTTRSQTTRSQSPKSQSTRSQSPMSQSPKSQSPKSPSPKSQSTKSQSPKSQSPKSPSPKSQSSKSKSSCGQSVTWSEDDDFLLLTTIQRENLTPSVFKKLKTGLNKNKTQIKKRLDFLLQKVAECS